MVTGNIESITQANDIVKEGGIIDGVSKLIDTALDKGEKYGIINDKISDVIKSGKKILLNNIEKNIDNNFDTQLESFEKIEKYISKWENYYEKKDFNNMDKQYNKIIDTMKDILPIENIITKARQIENIHNLIKNNGKNFDLSEEELELANKLI